MRGIVNEISGEVQPADAAHRVYQDTIAAYEQKNTKIGKRWMYNAIC